LIDCGDSLDSIFTSAAVAGKYTARRSGIGINMGRIRAVGSSIRDSEVISTGIVPFLRVMESTVKSTSQNGLRGGCLKKGTKVLVVESVEIDGKIYGINDIINGEPAYKLLQNGKMINPL
jgi:ribonucleotide reductase alpha subunit